jgi:hypothetical protein
MKQGDISMSTSLSKVANSYSNQVTRINNRIVEDRIQEEGLKIEDHLALRVKLAAQKVFEKC